MSETSTPVPSRRDAHKQRTSIALREAALELFASRGFDETTTEDIAEQAGVAVRTFFRYFPTKESVLFSRESIWMHAVADEYLAQAHGKRDLDALCASLAMAAPRLARARDTLFLYKRAIATSRVLQGREQDHRRVDAALLARAIATRHGLDEPDERCALVADVGLVLYRRALDAWLAGPATEDLGEVIAREFRFLDGIVMPG